MFVYVNFPALIVNRADMSGTIFVSNTRPNPSKELVVVETDGTLFGPKSLPTAMEELSAIVSEMLPQVLGWPASQMWSVGIQSTPLVGTLYGLVFRMTVSTVEVTSHAYKVLQPDPDAMTAREILDNPEEFERRVAAKAA